MARNEVVFDVETKKIFSDVGGRTHPGRLGVSVVGVYYYATGTFKAYAENELKYFFESIASADRLIGFNIKNFDIPVLQPYATYDISRIPAFDLLEDIANVLGFRISLDSLAKATLKSEKSGDGLNAVKLYRAGRMDELKAYCLQDVALTKDLYEFAKKEKKLYFYSPIGQLKEVSLSVPEPKSLTAPAIPNFQSVLF